LRLEHGILIGGYNFEADFFLFDAATLPYSGHP